MRERGKGDFSFHGFSVNDRDLVERSLKRQGFANVSAIEADASRFDWASLPPIDVMLIDVDLYQPSKATLVNAQPYWSPFARVMVDDVKDGTPFAGAHQAYVEFCDEQNYPLRMVGTKGGIVIADEHAVEAAPPLADVALAAAPARSLTR